jgi:hypothetical protein
VAGTGDVLRGLDLMADVGMQYDRTPFLARLLAGRRADGGFRTAVAFARATPDRRGDDGRGDLPVCGWADKAFRYLAGIHPRTGGSNTS